MSEKRSKSIWSSDPRNTAWSQGINPHFPFLICKALICILPMAYMTAYDWCWRSKVEDISCLRYLSLSVSDYTTVRVEQLLSTIIFNLKSLSSMQHPAMWHFFTIFNRSTLVFLLQIIHESCN